MQIEETEFEATISRRLGHGHFSFEGVAVASNDAKTAPLGG